MNLDGQKGKSCEIRNESHFNMLNLRSPGNLWMVVKSTLQLEIRV